MSQRMDETSDSYTVVVFRGSASKPLRFSFPRKFVHKLLVLVGLVVLADLLVISHYIVRTGEVWQLSAFQVEAMSARQQTVAFATAIDDLKKRLASMKEVNQRLRVMLGIDPIKQPGDLANGRGGEDSPIPVGGEEGNSSTLGPVSGADTVGMGRDSADRPAGQVSMLDQPSDQIAIQVREGIDLLTREASVQERALEELTRVAEQRSVQWASTPSIWPVKGWVTSGFGPRISPFTEKPGWHDGLDIGAAPNAPIQAPAQGRVTMVVFDSKMGNMVRIDHGYGIETVYGHLAKALVKEGQRVKRGDVVALVGNTGLSTGPHLHYMVKKNGQPLDPHRFILE